MIILPSAYLPPISYFTHILGGEAECAIDLGEHYIKRSVRNRTRIMTAQGVMDLTIPVRKANSPRQPMHSIEIDYSKRWQHQHWQAILSAYRSSPYFDHFAPYFEPLYSRETKYLVEFNEAMMDVICKLLKVSEAQRPTLHKEYVSAQLGDIDLRPKGRLDEGFSPQDYIQVFHDRLPFSPNLSILDLLLCEGITSREFLGAIQR